MRELNIAVIAPIHRQINKTVLLYSIKGELLINKYTPAVTMVAAWINADTGVGPSIAIGSHTCKPICELLAIAPISRHIPIKVKILLLIMGAIAKTVA